MIYIFCATKSEAQAVVEYKKLQKCTQNGMSLFSCDSVTLCITGVGKEATTKTIDSFEKQFSPTPDDIVLNIGIAAAPESFSIGSLHHIGRVVADGAEYLLQSEGETLACKNEPTSQIHATLVDMESCVLAERYLPYLQIYKVVSDHFDPSSVTKEGTKKLIAGALEAIEPLRN